MEKLKTKIGLLFVALMCNVNLVAQVSISLSNLNICPGKTQEVEINLHNGTVDITDFEGFVVVPEGISFVAAYNASYAKLTGRETSGQALTVELQPDGRLQFAVYQMTGTTGFSGQSGAVIAFTIKADENMTAGEYPIKIEEGLGVTIEADPYDLPWAGSINVYQYFKVDVAANDAKMGSVEGGNDEVMSNSNLTISATPAVGYHFVNWTSGGNAVSSVNPYTFKVTEDKVLTAVFAPNQYTITFDADGGTGVNDLTADYKATITKPANPVKKGYTFGGWTPDFPETMPLNGASLRASWMLTEYAITYSLDGGVMTEGKTNAATYTIESDGITLYAPVRTGYSFAGWIGTDLTEATKIVTVAIGSVGNRSYIATWIPNQYTMTFVLDNGEENITKTQDFGTALTPPDAPNKPNYTFTGWSQEVPQTIPASDMTFTAQWNVNKYKITWVVDGKSTVAEVNYGAPITKPQDPKKEGYSFTGWDKEIAETMPAEDLTYTAQFSIRQYTMTFVMDNGEDDVVKKQDYATVLTTPDTPVKPYHTFIGWSPDVPQAIPAADMTFTAQWEANKYYITWIVDGESTVTEVSYGDAVITLENPVKEGYSFIGWDKDIAETMPAEDVSYTAQFSINQYTMTFVLDNGDENVVKTQDYGTELTAPEGIQKAGFTFKGWDSEVPTTVPAANKTFTAQWGGDGYKLTWLIDGEPYMSSEMVYGATITPEVEPTKEGYTFSGWSEIPETMPANDVTITGSFIINKYKLTYLVDGKVYKTYEVEYGSAITPELQPEGDYIRFEWIDIPETMPAHDVTITADFETGIMEVVSENNIKYIYSSKGKRVNKLQKGVNIVMMKDGTIRKIMK